ncbi:MAG: chromosomal replication initiator protein DnaA, partial [Bacillota bacterium]|nr:chromosomal replication initiator protein DnaA [Bacillota bacterium]
LTEHTFILYTPSEFKKEIISQRFSKILASILKELLNDEFEINVLSGEDELAAYKAVSAEKPDRSTNDYYTFKHFVVGSSNRFAHAAAIAVAKNPSTAYNPLFIYGQSGLGKTHLLYAIAGEIEHRYPNFRILYIKGDDFTNELITSIQAGPDSVRAFRAKYRLADLLLVDDIQFIAGKERTQEEFFHTFNSLFEARKQIVLTSDRPPKEIKTLEDRLKTRFEWGLIADIQPPDYETRMAIIATKAGLIDFSLPDDVMQYLAGMITSNVRQLEGAVKKIKALHELMEKEVNIELAEIAIRDIFLENPGLNPTASLIIKEVATYFSITPDRLISLNRAKDTLMPRQVAMYLVRELTDLSLPEIGKEFGRDHSTVIHSINKIEDLVRSDSSIETTIKDLKTNIREK